MPHVCALEDADAGVGAQALVELAVGDVDGEHAGRPPLQQAVGEAAGGRARVESGPPADIDPEPVEGGVELLPSPADE
jgi:hypothetical protein